MRVKHIENSIIPRIMRVTAVTWYPFILYAGKIDPIVRNHEMVHVDQIRYYGFIRFYISYAVEYLSYRIRGDSHNVGYNKITYEKEAYAKQSSGTGNYS